MVWRACRAAPGLYWRGAVGGTMRGLQLRLVAVSTTSSPLIAAEALAQRLGEPGLRLFDCRFDLADPASGERDYRVSHLPGAVYVHLDRDLSGPVSATTGRHPLPAPTEFEARLRAWGLGAGTIAVAYDAGNSMYAARLWWMLRWLGHERSLVLDGGFARWRALGLPVDQAVTAATPGDFAAHARTDLAVDAATVLAVAADTGCRLLDARSPERFRGEVEPLDAVAGHVPGALNHPLTESLAADGRLRTPEELRRSFEATLGGVPASHVVAMCGSGVTACHLLLALEQAGLAGARLYPGSWSEWIRDPSRPVATGPQK
jgi:thiosulfate/3-mercaptopyruvate sulfurtransferase